MSFEVGQTIGDYQVIGVLGAGGMGQVYKVRNAISDRVEAMKVLLPNLASEPELADRFMREIKVLASLNHPNIAGLHTALRVQNQLLMIMELVEGITLEARLKQGPIPLADSVNYISQVADALAYAHEQGVIHRDIKPANMMLIANGVVKLMDFGIAKSATDQRMTMTGTTMGSLYYMSPEQVKGVPLDARADLYSLGVSLYELVTRRKPFQGDSNYAIMAAHLQMAPPPPIESDPSLPKPLNDIILTCLAKDPAQRFGSARALRNALEHVKAGLGPAGVPAGAAAPSATQVLGARDVTTQAPAGGPRTPPPVPSPLTPPLPPTSTRSSHSAYMVLGALVVVAVLVIAALELPHYLKTRAGSKAATQTMNPPTSPAPAAQPTNSPETSAAPASSPAGSVTTAPASSVPNPPSGAPPSTPVAAVSESGATEMRPAPSAGLPAEPARASHHRASGASRAAGFSATPASGGQSSQPATGTATAPAPASAGTPGAAGSPATSNNLAIEQLNDRMGPLAARANAVKSSLDNLRRQQEAQGVSLRPDIAASLSLMEQYMDAADRALSAGNATAAGKNMDLAERQVEKLEKFLGQ